MIKDALSAIPSRPVLYIAPVIVIVVLLLYYRDLYIKCSDIRQHRESDTDTGRIGAISAGGVHRVSLG
jgi:hypothetical protein